MRLFQAAIAIMGLGLTAFVVVGFLLPGNWSTERTRTVEVSVDSAWSVVSDLARWGAWSSLGQVDAEISAPSTGVGATLSWDDPLWGAGTLRLTGVSDGRSLEYGVAVDEGDIQTRGVIRLRGDAARTEVAWEESGDMGWNPLLSYFALGMERMQGEELNKALDRLEVLLETGSVPDSLAAGGDGD